MPECAYDPSARGVTRPVRGSAAALRPEAGTRRGESSGEERAGRCVADLRAGRRPVTVRDREVRRDSDDPSGRPRAAPHGLEVM